MGTVCTLHSPTILQLKLTPCHPLVLRQEMRRLVQDERLVSRLGMRLNYAKSIGPVGFNTEATVGESKDKDPELVTLS